MADVMTMIKARVYGDATRSQATAKRGAINAVAAGVIAGVAAQHLLKANQATSMTLGVAAAAAVWYGVGVGAG